MQIIHGQGQLIFVSFFLALGACSTNVNPDYSKWSPCEGESGQTLSEAFSCESICGLYVAHCSASYTRCGEEGNAADLNQGLDKRACVLGCMAQVATGESKSNDFENLCAVANATQPAMTSMMPEPAFDCRAIDKVVLNYCDEANAQPIGGASGNGGISGSGGISGGGGNGTDGGLSGNGGSAGLGGMAGGGGESGLSDAQVNRCGDGNVAGNEECDDGYPSDSCSENCRTIACGNGRVDPGEVCDDGNSDNDDACIDDCQSFFPSDDDDELLPNWTDLGVGLNSTSNSFCEGASKSIKFGNTNNNFGTREGAYSYNMVFTPSELWAPLPSTTSQNIKIEADFWVSSGYERSVEMSLTTTEPPSFSGSEADCLSVDSGQVAVIQHRDRNHDGVEISVQTASGQPNVLNSSSGVESADKWVTMTIIYLSHSNRIKFIYKYDNGQIFEHLTQLPATSSAPQSVRIRSTYVDPENSSESFISVSNLRIWGY